MNVGEIVNAAVKVSDSELVLLKTQIDVELKKRGLSLNVGELGERLSIEYFNSTPNLPNLFKAPTGAKNVDALSRDGDRYSIKAFMRAKKTGTVYPDAEEPKKQLFEYILVVGISNRYELEAIYRYSWAQFLNIRAWDKRMNAWYIPLSNKNLNNAELIFGKVK